MKCLAHISELCVYVCVRANMCACVRVCVHDSVCEHASVCVCECVCVHASLCVCVCVCLCVCEEGDAMIMGSGLDMVNKFL